MDNNFIKSGKWGECTWDIDESGSLFIGGGQAETLTYYDAPWKELAAEIIYAEAKDKVTFEDGASLMGLFAGCKNMKKADLSGFVTDNVTDMCRMFEDCVELKQLDISSFDTRKCTDMRGMFDKCVELTSILLGENFSPTGDGTTDCGKLAIKEYGKYKKARPIAFDVKVNYHSNNGEEATEERNTIADYRYTVEEPMFKAPSDEAVFKGWNTEENATGRMYQPGDEIEALNKSLDLYATWVYPPVVKDIAPIRSFVYGEAIPFELPEIISIGDPNVRGYLEISRTGEPGTWKAIDRNTILPVMISGCLLRLHVSNSVGTTVSNAVKLSIRKANIDMSAVRWAEEDDMVYNGQPKEIHIEGLPEGITPEYEGNVATEAGTYVASFSFDFDQDNYNEPAIKREHEWTIRKAPLDMSEVHWDYRGPFGYNGTERSVQLAGLPEGVTATYENNTATNAGVYTAIATLHYDDKNFENPVEILPCIWEIKKAVIEAFSIRWSKYSDFVYDGEPRKVSIVNLPEDAEVIYEGAEEILAGKYLARATLIGNYTANAAVEYEWEIKKARYDLSDAVWSEERSIVYDGAEHRMELTGVPEVLNIRYTGNVGITSGRYYARASFSNPDTHNFVTPEDMTLPWEIEKRVLDLSYVHWDYEEPFTYDGDIKGVRLIGVPEGVTVKYEDNTAYNAGVYNARAVLKYDSTNFEAAQPADCQWKINRSKVDVSGINWDYIAPFTYDGSEHGVYLTGLPEGLSVEYRDNVKITVGKYVATAVLTPADSHNFEVPEINGCTWAIGKAEISLGEVTWTDSSNFVYDGKEKRVGIISDLGDDLEVEYESESAVYAGRYFTRALFKAVDSDNFSAPGPVGYSWGIARAKHDMSGVFWDYENAFTYDGKLKTVRLMNVPDGIIVRYSNNSATDSGDYTAFASFEVQDANNYETEIPDMTLDWSIGKAIFDMSTVKWQSEREFVYSGDTQSVKLIGLPDGVEPIYSNNEAAGAGEYTARAEFKYDERNYERPEVGACLWQIYKSEIDASDAGWDYEGPFRYDGKEKVVSAVNLPEGTFAQYSNAAAINAGTYVASAEIIPEDSDNYIKTRLDNLTWKIKKSDYDMSHARWDYEKPFKYDGGEHRVVLRGLPEGVIAAYSGNSATDAGTYRASVSFTVADEQNFNAPEFESLEWTIEKADFDMSGTHWDYDGEFRYTGRLYEVTLRGLPEGVRAIYSGNAATDTGTYEASADLISYDPENYNKPVIKNCKWRIIKTDFDMSGVRWDYIDAKTYNGRPQGVLLDYLPNGVSAVYHENEKTDVGRYTASATLVVADPDNYNTPSVSDCDWEIVRADFDMSRVEWDYVDDMFTYDGSKKTVRLKGLPEDLRVSYKGNSESLAGNYLATASFTTENDNYREPASLSIPWSISRADCDMSRVRWDYTNSFTYDGSPKRVELKGLPEGVSVEYSENVAIDAGTYNAVARFSTETNEYNIPESMYCTWVIDKADVEIRNLRWNYSQGLVYNGSVRRVELEGIPEILDVSYTGNTGTAVGEYFAHAELTLKNSENYNVPQIRDLNWKIVKADYDMSNARWDSRMEYVYDGSEKAVFITGLPEGVAPIYHGNVAVNAGSYVAGADFVYDKENYNTPVLSDCRWNIKKASYDMSGTYWQYEDKIVYDGTVKSVALRGLPEGVTPVYSGNEAIDAGEYTASAEFRYDEVNYNRPSFGSCKWRIEPADMNLDISEVHWNYSGPFVYDGTAKSISLSGKQQSQGFFGMLRGKSEGPVISGIPEGYDVVYSNNTATNAGIYYAGAKLVSTGENYNFKELILPQCKWEIVKARVDMADVHWNYEKAFDYDGNEKRVELVNLPVEVKVSYTDNAGIAAGEYEAMALIEARDPDNYESPTQVGGCWWKINKAVYDMSQARWTYDDDIVYSGKEKSIRVVGLPEGVKVEAYTGNKAIEAGTYTAEAILKYQNKRNFEAPVMPLQKWRIRKKVIDTGDVVWNYDDSTLFVYDDKPKEVRLVGLPKDVDVIYVDNSKINAGTYTARARLVYDSHNCEAADVPDLKWRIEKATYDTTDVQWTYDRPFIYDGTEKSIMLQGVPGSINVRYRDNRASAIGTYTAKAYLTYDSDNYEAPEIKTMIEWEIVRKEAE